MATPSNGSVVVPNFDSTLIYSQVSNSPFAPRLESDLQNGHHRDASNDTTMTEASMVRESTVEATTHSSDAPNTGPTVASQNSLPQTESKEEGENNPAGEVIVNGSTLSQRTRGDDLFDAIRSGFLGAGREIMRVAEVAKGGFLQLASPLLPNEREDEMRQDPNFARRMRRKEKKYRIINRMSRSSNVSLLLLCVAVILLALITGSAELYRLRYEDVDTRFGVFRVCNETKCRLPRRSATRIEPVAVIINTTTNATVYLGGCSLSNAFVDFRIEWLWSLTILHILWNLLGCAAAFATTFSPTMPHLHAIIGSCGLVSGAFGIAFSVVVDKFFYQDLYCGSVCLAIFGSQVNADAKQCAFTTGFGLPIIYSCNVLQAIVGVQGWRMRGVLRSIFIEVENEMETELEQERLALVNSGDMELTDRQDAECDPNQVTSPDSANLANHCEEAKKEGEGVSEGNSTLSGTHTSTKTATRRRAATYAAVPVSMTSFSAVVTSSTSTVPAAVDIAPEFGSDSVERRSKTKKKTFVSAHLKKTHYEKNSDGGAPTPTPSGGNAFGEGEMVGGEILVTEPTICTADPTTQNSPQKNKSFTQRSDSRSVSSVGAHGGRVHSINLSELIQSDLMRSGGSARSHNRSLSGSMASVGELPSTIAPYTGPVLDHPHMSALDMGVQIIGAHDWVYDEKNDMYYSFDIDTFWDPMNEEYFQVSLGRWTKYLDPRKQHRRQTSGSNISNGSSH